MIAKKAVVKNGLIKPLEAIDLPEDNEIVFISLKKKRKKRAAFSFFLLLTSGMTHEKIYTQKT